MSTLGEIQAAALPPGAPDRRLAVVDLGSNSVRLVVFEGLARNPVALFNEKAVLRLGRGIETTGKLGDDAMALTKTVLARYHAVARAMGASVFEVLATAAVREAKNGPAFMADLAAMLPGVPMHVLSGEEEATLSAEGVVCGIPQANGILADIGGGSLELARLKHGEARAMATLKLGVLRLAERAGGDLVRARALVEEALKGVDFLRHGEGADLYLVGGAFRALARIHMTQIGYPLNILHHYSVRREEARDLTHMVSTIGRRGLERIPGVSRRRLDDLPFAAVVLRRVLRAAQPRRVVFSASGLREGWLFRQLPAPMRAEDPLLAWARQTALRLSRDAATPEALIAWTAALFPDEAAEARRLREAACYLSDTGCLDHPEYRAALGFERVLWQPGIGVDHHARAFLALCIAGRYDAPPDAPFLAPARLLLDLASATRAETLGKALHLAYALSAGTPALLARTRLHVRDGRLVLRLEGDGAYVGEGLLRRMDALAQGLGLEATVEDGDMT